MTSFPLELEYLLSLYGRAKSRRIMTIRISSTSTVHDFRNVFNISRPCKYNDVTFHSISILPYPSPNDDHVLHSELSFIEDIYLRHMNNSHFRYLSHFKIHAMKISANCNTLILIALLI